MKNLLLIPLWIAIWLLFGWKFTLLVGGLFAITYIARYAYDKRRETRNIA
jgi:hypothetical protein